MNLQERIIRQFTAHAETSQETLLRLGDLTSYVSHSVVVGFTAGAGTLLVLDQLKNLLGQKAIGSADDYFLLRVYHSLTEGGAVHGPTLAIGLTSVTLALALRWVKDRMRWPLFPDLLLVVVVMAAATAWLGLDQAG